MTSEYSVFMDKMATLKPICEECMRKLHTIVIPDDQRFSQFFKKGRKVLMQSWDFYQMLTNDPQLSGLSLEEAATMSISYYAELDPESGYHKSLANPDVAVELFGDEFGALLAAIYTQIRGLKQHLLKHNYAEAASMMQLYFTLFELSQAGQEDYPQWLAAYKQSTQENLELKAEFNTLLRISPEFDYFRRIVEDADLNDLRYLYRYGIRINQYDIAMAEYISAYNPLELEAMARYIVQCWIDGFKRARKDYRIKRYATVMLPVGMEGLGRIIIRELKALGIESIVPVPMNQSINRQFPYDHRFDSALSLDREFVETNLNLAAMVMEKHKDMIQVQAGPVYVELFGETPFTPVSKTSALKLSDDQQGLYREFMGRNTQLYFQYYRRDESSFCIIAFPSPEIGSQFQEIFADTLKINLLDSGRYATIQQKIIDVLDTADYVHVKGKSGNATDILVKMHPLTDPEHQTLFENCVADVNIPVGEVFTSPLLSGTNGTLHVEDIYLGSLRYYNLRIDFEDGYVKDYSCTNFADQEEGRKYIHENLLLPHKTLPIGEFAIGTNTTAYQIAKKYDILSLLPILIIEKMGPHFAIGDTCFSHEEDAPHPSFVNGKEMIAVQNEKSALRKEDPMQAYTQKHMDITLPYEMLASISAVAKDGTRTDIILNGRFVVPGTEELNIPLDEMSHK